MFYNEEEKGMLALMQGGGSTVKEMVDYLKNNNIDVEKQANFTLSDGTLVRISYRLWIYHLVLL